MDAQAFLDWSVQIALVLLSISFLMTIGRVIVGPTLPDRVLALDLLVAAAIGFIAVLGIKTGFTLYIDIAIALGLVGFLATVAFARFILSRGMREDGTPACEPLTAEQSAKLSATNASSLVSPAEPVAMPKMGDHADA
ncbi:MAG: cation:proton antiporter [Pseudomonadota bacterium]